MQLGRVVGHAVSTVKHPSLSGWRLLLVQVLSADGSEDGEPVLALDSLGAGREDWVLMTSDGLAARELVKSRNSPARWTVLGVCDQ